MKSKLRVSTVALSTLAAREKYALVGGPFGSNLVSADYVDRGVPVIRGVNLPFEGRFSWDDLVFVSEDKADKLKSNLAYPGDLVFTQRGTLGQIGLIPKDAPYERFVISQSQMKMTVDEAKASSVYLFYYFRLRSTIEQIHNHALQSGVPHINLGILRDFKVIAPPVRLQYKIASILSAYDDLIENNKRRIAILEKMAEEIYREWFVRMRFPGYETSRLRKGIPTDWKIAKGNELFDVVKGKSYASNELSEDPEQMPFINLKSFNRGGGYRRSGLKYYSGRYSERQVAKVNDIVVAVTDMTQEREVVGEAARVPDIGDKGAVISLDVVKLAPKAINLNFLYGYMRFSGFAKQLKEFANGANVLHLKPDLIGSQLVLTPTPELQQRYAEIASPLYRQIDLLDAQIENLKSQRDLLLPRLISGKLSVDNLELPSNGEHASVSSASPQQELAHA